MDLANETTSTTSRGAAITSTYTNQPVMYGKDFMEAAKDRFFFLEAVKVAYTEKGHKDYIEYKRTQFLGENGITFGSGEATTADITATAPDNLTGVQITPAYDTARITVTEWNVHTNRFNLIERFREELVYAVADKVDQYIATTIGDATEATSVLSGATMLYGGDATSDSTLAEGDILTPELIVKGSRYLRGKSVYYWNSTTFTKVAAATAESNPWPNEDDYVLYMGPAQYMHLQQDSQFTNAAEYGSQGVVLNGQIAKYQGIKIVLTNNVEAVASDAIGPDGTTASADMTRCILMKPKKAFTFVWGKQPEVTISPYERRKQQDIVMDFAYAGSVIHSDAIVFLDVADDAI